MPASGPSGLPVIPRGGNRAVAGEGDGLARARRAARVRDCDEHVAQNRATGSRSGQTRSRSSPSAVIPDQRRNAGQHAPRREEAVSGAREHDAACLHQPRLGDRSVEPLLDLRRERAIVEEGGERLAAIAGRRCRPFAGRLFRCSFRSSFLVGPHLGRSRGGRRRESGCPRRDRHARARGASGGVRVDRRRRASPRTRGTSASPVRGTCPGAARQHGPRRS